MTGLNMLLILLVIPSVLSSSHHNESAHDASNVLAKWQFEEYSTHITLMLFLICVILLLTAYQNLQRFTTWIPESLVLIVAGVMFGAVLRALSSEEQMWKLQPDLFFHYLLPPIVLEAAYAMYDRAVIDYLGAIMLFAVFGSLLNFILIAMPMYGLYLANTFGGPYLDLDAKGFLLLSSFIIAVDPVAVLAIFQDIGVDLGLYYMVFGESLFNDAVTVVLYQVVSTFAGLSEIDARHIAIALFSFFTISLGGVIIGVAGGVITCLLTRFHSSMGAVTVLIMGYFSYILCDCIGWSGIISMVCCGLVQTAYAFHNISRASLNMVRKMTKITAELSESIIFLFMGIEVVSRNFEWHTGFCLWALFLCLAVRALVTVTLSFLLNLSNTGHPMISFTEQVILLYGGLRGAVCFCLAVLIEPHYFIDRGAYKRELFITTAVFIIFFTTFVMGMTIKPLVMWLRIPMRKEKKLSLFHELNEHIIDEVLVVMEIIVGKKGSNAMRDFFYDIDDKYIRKVLQRDPQTHDQKLIHLYEKIALKLHYATMQPANSEMHLNRLAPNLKQQFTVERKPSITSISNALLPDEFLPAEAKPVKAEPLHKPSSESMIDDDSEFEEFEPAKPLKFSCIKRKHKSEKASEQPTERKSIFALPRPSMMGGQIPDDQLIMRQYLRSSRHASIISKDAQDSEFAENLMSVLRSKSIVASRMQQAYMSRAQTSAPQQRVDLKHEVPYVQKIRKRDGTASNTTSNREHHGTPNSTTEPQSSHAPVQGRTAGQGGGHTNKPGN